MSLNNYFSEKSCHVTLYTQESTFPTEQKASFGINVDFNQVDTIVQALPGKINFLGLKDTESYLKDLEFNEKINYNQINLEPEPVVTGGEDICDINFLGPDSEIRGEEDILDLSNCTEPKPEHAVSEENEIGFSKLPAPDFFNWSGEDSETSIIKKTFKQMRIYEAKSKKHKKN